MSDTLASPSPESDSTWKRKYKELEAELAVSKNLDPTAATVKALQIRSGRGMRRIVDMFAMPVDLIMEKHRRLEGEASDEVVSSTVEEARLYSSYSLLIKHVPLVKTLDESGNDIALDGLCANLLAGAANARGDDAGKMKAAIVTWLNADHGPSIPPLRLNSKDERGLTNILTGGLLRPAVYDWNDESIRTLILDGNADYAVTAQDWPAFCYADNNCNPEDIQDGLFRGPLLVKAYKFLMMSPSSVNDSDADMAPPPLKRKKQATRSNVSALIGLKSVSSRAIAYVALQLRFSLSNANTWKTEDSQFDNQEFYYAIVDYFDDTPGPKAEEHVKELLAWWNVQVFGRCSGVAQPAARSAASSVSRMAEQRRARETADA